MSRHRPQALRLVVAVAAVAIAGLSASLVGGCGGSILHDRTSRVTDLARTARENGAYKCAPRELALAESHLEFARVEISEGDYYRARQELVVAERNANEAIRKSPKDQCASQPVVVVERLDRDKDGLFDDEDRCPTEPEDFDGFQDDDGCPDLDNDADGIPDATDKCPAVPEDKDGFEDDDGCPDDDNDKDGLADKVDQCPNDAEDKDGFEDDDGCPDKDNDKDGVPDAPQAVDKCPNEPAPGTPDGCPQKYTLVVVTREKIEIKETIYFEFKKATIKPVSYPLLDQVAQALVDNPTIQVRVEGHTDSRGNDRFNLKLSQKRAESVRAYLVKKGISAARLEAKGYGESAPIADNRTEDGRSMNRRVEFIITSR